MRRAAVYRIQRFFALISFIILLVILIIAARLANMGISWDEFLLTQNVAIPMPMPVINSRVALISGHAGYDSGAVCTDSEGKTILTEAEVTADIAERTAEMLRRDGTVVAILDEYDPRITNLEVDALVSLHADSCISASGYKAAFYLFSTIPDEDARLVRCIDAIYPATTGLAQHADTITHNMTEYHAFRKVSTTTPAAILELGFLGGDRELLTGQSELAALGVADSIRCFLENAEPTPTPAPSPTATN